MAINIQNANNTNKDTDIPHLVTPMFLACIHQE